MSGNRILVVDDSPTQLEAARTLLETNGYEVHTASTGGEALEAIRRDRYALIMSDVLMPGMSGFELCAAIKEELEQAPPVVLLTSLSDPRDIVRGVECGADNYITKPYAPEQLVQRIAYVLENQRLREESPGEGPLRISFLGEAFTVPSDPARILALLLSSFEELIRTNAALQESKRQLAEAHARELEREQSARARAEADTRRLDMLKRKAEAAALARDEVLATVSHDLKNPVGTIYASASLLLDLPLSADAQRRQIEIIRKTARRMDRLIQDLLDISRMEAGAFSLERRPVDIRGIMGEAREMLAPLAAARAIEIEVHAPPDRVAVSADRDRVLQVLSNLIGNAVKFTPERGRIRLSAVPQGEQVRVTVHDSGPGIREADLARIFERFWQSGEGAGSGLGLAIARGIVDAHGGSIWAENSERGGAMFHFTLPLASVEAGIGLDREPR